MPIYEYQCRQCHSRFDRLEIISQEPLRLCPSCGGDAQRLVSKTVGLALEGSSAGQPQDTHCGKTSPCCGRETRCDERPCDWKWLEYSININPALWFLSPAWYWSRRYFHSAIIINLILVTIVIVRRVNSLSLSILKSSPTRTFQLISHHHPSW